MTDTATPPVPSFRLLSIADEPPPKNIGRPPSPIVLELTALARELEPDQWACILRAETPDAAKTVLSTIPSKVRTQFGICLRSNELWMTPNPPAKDLGNVGRIAQAIGMSEATVYPALKELRTDGTLPPNAGR